MNAGKALACALVLALAVILATLKRGRDPDDPTS